MHGVELYKDWFFCIDGHRIDLIDFRAVYTSTSGHFWFRFHPNFRCMQPTSTNRMTDRWVSAECLPLEGSYLAALPSFIRVVVSHPASDYGYDEASFRGPRQLGSEKERVHHANCRSLCMPWVSVLIFLVKFSLQKHARGAAHPQRFSVSHEKNK